jgi:hypothetical protein
MLQIVPVVLEKQRKKKPAEMAGAGEGKLDAFADGSKQLSACRGIARRRYDEPIVTAAARMGLAVPRPSSPTTENAK